MTQQQQGALRAAALEALYEACSYAGLAAHDLAGPMEKHNARDMYDEAKRAIEALAALAGEHEPAARSHDGTDLSYPGIPEPAALRWNGGSGAIERPAQPEPLDKTWRALQIIHASYELVAAMQAAGDDSKARGRAADAFGYAVHAALATPAPGEQPANPSEGHAGVEDVRMCACKDRPASECAEEWGPDCDLGNNPKFARRGSPETQAAIEAALTPSEAPSAKEAPISAALLSEVLAKLDDDDLVRRVQTAWGAPPITPAEGEKR